MGHIHHQEGPVAVGDLSQLFEVDGTGVGRSACHDHLGSDLFDLLFQLSIVDAAIFADAVGYEVIVLTGHIHRRAVGQMTALRQVHAHNGIAQIEQGEVDGQIGLCAGVGLDVGVLCAEQLAGALDGDVLHLIHVGAAAVVALAGQALGVLVGEDAAHGGHDGGRDDVLTGDQLNVLPLAGQLTVHGRSQLRVGLFHEANGIHHIVVHHTLPLSDADAEISFFSIIPDNVKFFNSISHKPIRFGPFLFGRMKIFHPSAQSLAFSAPSVYYTSIKIRSGFCAVLSAGRREGRFSMTIAEQKAAQRKAGIAARRALSEADRTSANAALCARIAGLDCFRTAQNILLYAAFGGEADLSALAGQAAAQGKILAWPVCGEGFSLTAAVPEADGWEVGAYGIRTPVLRRSALLRPDQLDLVLVPCTAFDAACRRVGMGKGYYDRYLPRCTRAVKVGVAFEAQRVEAAAVDAHDQRLDGFVTEGGLYFGTDTTEL